jgi:hypothetical protein
MQESAKKWRTLYGVIARYCDHIVILGRRTHEPSQVSAPTP